MVIEMRSIIFLYFVNISFSPSTRKGFNDTNLSGALDSELCRTIWGLRE
jgi:hypothetical protein